MAEGVAGGGVDGDPVVVADGGDLGAGAAGADVDAQAAQADGAVGADGQGVDGGVVLAGQAAGWTPTGFVDTIRSGTMVYEERTGSGTGSQEVHPGI